MTPIHKKKIIAIVAVLVVLGMLVALFWFRDEPDEPAPVDPFDDYYEEPALIGHSTDGVLVLQEGREGEELDRFDLKDLSAEIEAVVTEDGPKLPEQPAPIEEPVVEEPEEEPTPDTPKEEPTDRYYGEFEKITVKIVKHDNAWNIQTKLTPRRNTIEMLRLVRELNDGYEMHPIYPGDEYVFLKEKDAEVDEEEVGVEVQDPEPEPTPEPEPEPTPEPEQETVVTTEDSYIYYQDHSNATLLAYSNLNEAVYEITAENGTLEVTETKVADGGDADRFIRTANGTYVFFHEDKVARIIQDGVTQIDLFGKPVSVAVAGENVVYAYDREIARIDTVSGETDQVHIGDQIREMVVKDEQVYALNIFGKTAGNSLLLEIDPSTLYVDKLLELDEEFSSIVSHGRENELYVSRILKEEGKETPQVVKVHLGQLTVDRIDEVTVKRFLSNGSQLMNLVYTKDQDTLEIYDLTEQAQLSSFAMMSEDYMPIGLKKEETE